ncbi:hypothetical protein ES703_101600 [subsurface metagenome]
MLVIPPRLPILNTVFRQMNERVSTISPLSVDASLRNVRVGETPLKGSLDIDITEKRTGVGVPLAPFMLYVNDIEEFKGRCNTKGKHTHELSLKDHRSTIDIYHNRKRLVEASDHLRVLWDNFNDNSLDRRTWQTFAGASVYEGRSETKEEDRKLKFISTNTGYLAGVSTKDPVNIAESSIKVKLYSGGWVVCFLSILPSNTPFYGASYNKGYDIGIWENGITKFVIYSGGSVPYRKGTIRSNPETIEVVVEDDVIRFLEEGHEVYKEVYKPASKLCNIFLWGQSWYHMRGGISWADDLLVIGD